MKYYLLVVPFLLYHTAKGQTLPETPVQQRTAGAAGQDEFVSLTVNWRGDLAAVGNAARGQQGGQDISFVVFDAALNKLLERHIGRQGDDGARHIAVLPDGRYLVAGYSTRPGARHKSRAKYFGKRDGWLLVLNERGDTEQELLLGSSADDEFVSATVCHDGSVWLVGNSGAEAWLVRLDASLQLLWERRVRYHQLPTRAEAATLTTEGNLYIVGGIRELERKHLWLAGFNTDGKALMEKIYPSSQAENGTGIVSLNTNTLAITGVIDDPRERENGFVSIIDLGGVMQHYQMLGGREYDRLHALLRTHRGSLVAAGGSASFERGSRRISAWLSLLDEKGNPEQNRYYGSKLDDEVLALSEHPDGRLFAVGATARHVLKMKQGWLFQLTERSERTAKADAIQVQFGQVFYPENTEKKEYQRSFLPFSLYNTTDKGYCNIRATIRAHDASAETALQLPGKRSVLLPPVAPGEKLRWGIPLQYPGNTPPGNYSYSVQLYQNDTPLGPPHTFDLIIPDTTRTNISAQTPPEKQPDIQYAHNNSGGNPIAIWIYPNPDNFEGSTIVWNQEEITVQVKIISGKALERKHFCIEINGEPCPSGAKFDEVQIKGDRTNKTFSQNIRLQKGENNIKAILQTSEGTVQSEALHIIYEPAKPNLHILSIGIPSVDLKYTSKDASDFAQALASKDNAAFGKIFLDTLVLETRTTKTAIMKTLRRLQYRYNDLQILPKDLLVIFVSGHGLGAYDGSFRLAASDYDAPFLQETSLDFEQEIVHYLKSLPCRKLFFVDACHSGTVAGAGLAGIAARNHGLDMLVSCQADEFSYEDDTWENGAFTHALVRGIQLFTTNTTAIDINHDQQLDLDELFKFTQKDVPALVQKKRPKTKTEQHPNLILSNEGRAPVLFMLKKN